VTRSQLLATYNPEIITEGHAQQWS